MYATREYAGWPAPTGRPIDPRLKPNDRTRVKVIQQPTYPGSVHGTSTAYYVFPLGKHTWFQYMTSWNFENIYDDFPPIGFWNRLKYNLDDNILFPCSACGKQHVHYSGGECPCGEPFPHKYKKVSCRS